MRAILLIVLIATLAAAAAAAGPVSPIRPVSTYSIVARDPDTGDLGVAVQSHWFSVGSLVPWARAGVGAVATQSMVNPAYGPQGLDLMAAGESAAGALGRLLDADPAAAIRQVGMVDARGGAATYTGDRCIAVAGGLTGGGYAVQANLMAGEGVPEAMAEAFEKTGGPLAERMLAALAAAEAAGGDIRGRQSAAIVVVRGESTGEAWSDVRLDLQVADHPDPVVELRRLLRLHRGYELMNEGDVAVEEGDLSGALQAYGEAESILGHNLEALFWHAVALANAGLIDESLPLFAEAFARGENWRELVPRLVPPGFLLVNEIDLRRIVTADR